MRIVALLNKIGKIAIISVFIMLSGCLTDEQIKEKALKSPTEDILQYPEVAAYLQKHKVYISLTTSPTRIKTLKMVLDTLDLTYVENILLVLPDQYGRTGERYTVPDEVRHFPKLKIVMIPQDLGPLSKLVPAVEDVMKISPDDEAIIITVDDDTAYPKGQIGGLVKHVILRDAVVSASGIDIDMLNVDRKHWPEPALPNPPCYSGVRRCDIVEAFAGIAYKIEHLKKAGGTAELIRLSNLGLPDRRDCFLSDDLIISFALAKAKIPKWVVSDGFVYLPGQYSTGFGPDALHQGANGTSANNWQKYETCFSLYLSKI